MNSGVSRVSGLVVGQISDSVRAPTVSRGNRNGVLPAEHHRGLIRPARRSQAKPSEFMKTREVIEAFATAAGAPGALPLIGPIRLKKSIGSAPVDLPIWVGVIETPPATIDSTLET
jgi:hypothetical protein